MAKKLSGWQSEDGQVFTSEQECLDYERAYKIICKVTVDRDYNDNDYSIGEDSFRQYQIKVARALAKTKEVEVKDV